MSEDLINAYNFFAENPINNFIGFAIEINRKRYLHE